MKLSYSSLLVITLAFFTINSAVSTPIEKIDDSKNSTVSGLDVPKGFAKGFKNGFVNGVPKGLAKGFVKAPKGDKVPKGFAKGFKKGFVNGVPKGLAKGVPFYQMLERVTIQNGLLNPESINWRHINNIMQQCTPTR
ncbi:hypothetical protein C1645_731814 [Glomus cerebriforme]|uniref:Uncharacterized protein n=1 Tax=Glomus cerebriforme TaxID=658196 RepID=A0A397TP20_9GLOM|nr:hypothetical protein C1645_731814 [Glomus cerebriforme]